MVPSVSPSFVTTHFLDGKSATSATFSSRVVHNEPDHILFLELPRDIEEFRLIESGLITKNYQVKEVEGEQAYGPSVQTLQQLLSVLENTKSNNISLQSLFTAQLNHSKSKIHYFAIVGSAARHCIAESEIIDLFEKRGLKHILFNENGSPTRFLLCIRAAANDIDGRTVLVPESSWDDIENCTRILTDLVPGAIVTNGREFLTFRDSKIDITVGTFTGRRFSPYLFENTRFEIHILNPAAFFNEPSTLLLKYETFGKPFLQFLCYQGLEILDAEDPEFRNYTAIVNYFIKLLKGAICHNPKLVPTFFNAFFEKYHYQGDSWPIKAASMMRHIVEAHAQDRGHMMIYLAFMMELAADQVPEAYQHLSTASRWQLLWNELFNDPGWEKYRSISSPLYKLRCYSQLSKVCVEAFLGFAGIAWLSLSAESTHFSLTNYLGKPALYVGMLKFGLQNEKPNQLLLQFDILRWVNALVDHPALNHISEKEKLELLFSFFHYSEISSKNSILSKYPQILLNSADKLVEKVEKLIEKGGLYNLSVAAILLIALSEVGVKQCNERLILEVLPDLYIRNEEGSLKVFKDLFAQYALRPLICQNRQKEIKSALRANQWWLALASTGSSFCCEIVSKHFQSTSLPEKQQIFTLIWQFAPHVAISHFNNDPEAFTDEFLYYIFTKFPINFQAIPNSQFHSDKVSQYLSILDRVGEAGYSIPLKESVSFFIQNYPDLHTQLYYFILERMDKEDPDNKVLLSNCTLKLALTEYLKQFSAQIKAGKLKIAHHTFGYLITHSRNLPADEQKEFKTLATEFCNLYWNSLETITQKVKFCLSSEVAMMSKDKALQNRFYNELISNFEEKDINTLTIREINIVLLNWLKNTSKDQNFHPYIELKVLRILGYTIAQTSKPQYILYQLLLLSTNHHLFKTDPNKSLLNTYIFQLCRQTCDFPSSFPINKAAELFLKTGLSIQHNKLILDMISLLVSSVATNDIRLCYALAKRLDLKVLQTDESKRWQALIRHFCHNAYHIQETHYLDETARVVESIKLFQEFYYQLRLDLLSRNIQSAAKESNEILISLIRNSPSLNKQQKSQLSHLLFCSLNEPKLTNVDWVLQESLLFLSQIERCKLINHYIKVRAPEATKKQVEGLLNEIQSLSSARESVTEIAYAYTDVVQYILTHYLKSGLPKRSSVLDSIKPYILPEHHTLWQSFTLNMINACLESNYMREAVNSLQYLDEASSQEIADKFTNNLEATLNSQQLDIAVIAQCYHAFPRHISCDNWALLWTKLTNQKCVESLSKVFLETFPLKTVKEFPNHLSIHKTAMRNAFKQIPYLAKQYLTNSDFLNFVAYLVKQDKETEFLLPLIFKMGIEQKMGSFIDQLYAKVYFKIFDKTNRLRIYFYYLQHSINFPAIYVASMSKQNITPSDLFNSDINEVVISFLSCVKNISSSHNLSEQIKILSLLFNVYHKKSIKEEWLPVVDGFLSLAQQEKNVSTQTKQLIWKLIRYYTGQKKKLEAILSSHSKIVLAFFENSVSKTDFSINQDLMYCFPALCTTRLPTNNLNKQLCNLLDVYLSQLGNPQHWSTEYNLQMQLFEDVYPLIKFLTPEQHSTLYPLLLKSIKKYIFHIANSKDLHIKNVNGYTFKEELSRTVQSCEILLDIFGLFVKSALAGRTQFFYSLNAFATYINKIASNFEKNSTLQINLTRIYQYAYQIILALNAFFPKNSTEYSNIWQILSEPLTLLFDKMHKTLDSKVPKQKEFRPEFLPPLEMIGVLRILDFTSVSFLFNAYQNNFFHSVQDDNLYIFINETIRFSLLNTSAKGKLSSFKETTSNLPIEKMLQINAYKTLHIMNKVLKDYSTSLLESSNCSAEILEEFSSALSISYIRFLTKIQNYSEKSGDYEVLKTFILSFEENFYIQILKRDNVSYDKIIKNLDLLISQILISSPTELSSATHSIMIGILKNIGQFPELHKLHLNCIQFVLNPTHPARMQVSQLIENLDEKGFVTIAEADITIFKLPAIETQIRYFNDLVDRCKTDNNTIEEFCQSASRFFKYSLILLSTRHNFSIPSEYLYDIMKNGKFLIVTLIEANQNEKALEVFLDILESPVGNQFANSNVDLIEMLITSCIQRKQGMDLVMNALHGLGTVKFWEFSNKKREKDNFLNMVFKLFQPSVGGNGWREVISYYVMLNLNTNPVHLAWCLALPDTKLDKVNIFIHFQKACSDVSFIFSTLLLLEKAEETNPFVEKDSTFLKQILLKLGDDISKNQKCLLNFLDSNICKAYTTKKPAYLRKSIYELIVKIPYSQQVHFILQRLLEKYFEIPFCDEDPLCLPILESTIEKMMERSVEVCTHDSSAITPSFKKCIYSALANKKYSHSIIPRLFNALKKSVIKFSELLTESELDECLEVIFSKSKDKELLLDILKNKVHFDLAQQMRVKLAMRYFNSGHILSYYWIYQFLMYSSKKEQPVSPIPGYFFTTVIAMIKSIKSNDEIDLLGDLIQWLQNHSQDRLADLGLESIILPLVENGISSNDSAVNLLCNLINHDVITMNETVLNVCMAQIKKDKSTGPILLGLLKKIPEAIVLSTVQEYLALSKLDPADVSLLIYSLQHVNYKSLDITTKEKLDKLWLTLMTNKLMMNSDLLMEVIKKSSIFHIGTTLSKKKQSKLNYCIFKCLIVLLPKLDLKQRVKLLRLRLRIYDNFSELVELDRMFFEGKMRLPKDVILSLNREVSQDYDNNPLPFRFIEFLTRLSVLRIEKFNEKSKSDDHHTLNKALDLIWKYIHVKEMLTIFDKILDRTDWEYNDLYKCLNGILQNTEIQNQDKPEIKRILDKFSSLIPNNFTFQERWNMVVACLEQPNVKLLFKESDQYNELIDNAIDYCLEDDIADTELNEIKWQVIEKMLKNVKIKFQAYNKILETIFRWNMNLFTLKDIQDPILQIEENSNRFISILQSTENMPNNELLSGYYFNFILSARRYHIQNKDHAYAFLEWIYHKLCLHYHISDTGYYFKVFAMLFSQPFAMRYDNLERTRQLAQQFLQQNQKLNSKEALSSKIFLKWLTDPGSISNQFNSSAIVLASTFTQEDSICGFIEISSLILSATNLIDKKYIETIQTNCLLEAFKGVEGIIVSINNGHVVDIDKIDILISKINNLVVILSKDPAHYMTLLSLLDKLGDELLGQKSLFEYYKKFISHFCITLQIFNKVHAQNVKLFKDFGDEYIKLLSKYPKLVANVILKEPCSEYAFALFKIFATALTDIHPEIPPKYRNNINFNLCSEFITVFYHHPSSEVQTLLTKVVKETSLMSKLPIETRITFNNSKGGNLKTDDISFVDSSDQLRFMLKTIALRDILS